MFPLKRAGKITVHNKNASNKKKRLLTVDRREAPNKGFNISNSLKQNT